MNQPLPSAEKLVASYQWKNRLLLVFAPAAADLDYQRQQELLRAERDALAERDLLVGAILAEGSAQLGDHSIAPEQAATLAHRYGVDPAVFAVVLIGKDGGAKYRSTDPITPDQLFGMVDAMPMRQREMRQGD